MPNSAIPPPVPHGRAPDALDVAPPPLLITYRYRPPVLTTRETGFDPPEVNGECAPWVRFPVKSSILKAAIWLYCVPRTHMNPIVPPPHAVMPRPIATDTTKAIETRPILLNFMRFLNPRKRPIFGHLLSRAIL